jgi:nucleotide-binding universal stress UspA family protein
MQRFKNILCVIERGDTSELALERAVTLAETNRASLTVVAAIPHMTAGIGMPDGGPITLDLQDIMKKENLARLERLIEPYRQRIDIKHRVLLGTSFLEIIREVLREGHDLLIKCPESPEWLERLFTGDDMHLLRKCPCPIWFIKPHPPGRYQRILAAVDVNDVHPHNELETRRALHKKIMEIAASLSISEFAELHVVTAWEAVGESVLRSSAFARQPKDQVDAYVEEVHQHYAQLLDELMRQTAETLESDTMNYLKPVLYMPKGPACKEVPELAGRLRVDCVVMGTVARTGIRGFFMGNTAETILEQLNCSVLAIKPPGFVTPVGLDD